MIEDEMRGDDLLATVPQGDTVATIQEAREAWFKEMEATEEKWTARVKKQTMFRNVSIVLLVIWSAIAAYNFYLFYKVRHDASQPVPCVSVPGTSGTPAERGKP